MFLLLKHKLLLSKQIDFFAIQYNLSIFERLKKLLGFGVVFVFEAVSWRIEEFGAFEKRLQILVLFFVFVFDVLWATRRRQFRLREIHQR